VSIGTGTFRPQQCELHLSTAQFRQAIHVPASIVSADLYAGATPGSVVVEYPTVYAEPGAVSIGQTARLTIGSKTVFRGTVGAAPFAVSAGSDSLSLILYDDKWRMNRRIVGEPDIGPNGDEWNKYFTDVGQEIIFNKDNRPNKDPAELDFCTGSNAVYWTLSTALQAVFEWWVDDDIDLYIGGLDSVYNRKPAHFVAKGSTALSAVDQLFEMAGDTWALRPDAEGNVARRCRPGYGTRRTLRMFDPKTRKSVTSGSKWSLDNIDINITMLNNRDVHAAESSPIVVESTYSTAGGDPLLYRVEDFTDKKFAARYAVNVGNYAANGLGVDLSDGSRPKRWLPRLVTRMAASGDTYVTAAQIAASPILAELPALDLQLWLVPSGASFDNAQLVLSGYEIDTEHCLVDFEKEIEVVNDAGESGTGSVEDWSDVDIWLTVATVLESREYKIFGFAEPYLPEQYTKLLDKSDLQPERRYKSLMPDLDTASVNDAVQIAWSEEEKYIDVTDDLQDAVLSSLAASPQTEISMQIGLPFFPVLDIGDRVVLAGRDTDATGDEIVTHITYRAVEARTSLDATNVVAGVDPENFIGRAG